MEDIKDLLLYIQQQQEEEETNWAEDLINLILEQNYQKEN